MGQRVWLAWWTCCGCDRTVVKAKLDIPEQQSLKFEIHKDSSNKTSSVIKPLLTV